MVQDYKYYIPLSVGNFLEGEIQAYDPEDAAKEAVRYEIEEVGNDIRDGNQLVKIVDGLGRCFNKTIKVDTVITYQCVG